MVLLVALTFYVWEFLVEIKVLDPLLVASPSRFLIEIPRVIMSPRFIEAFRDTIFNTAMGIVLSIPLGLFVGFVLGTLTHLRDAFSPYVLFLFMLPKIVILPLFMLLFGIGTTCRILFSAFHGFFPVCINAMEGVVSVKRSSLVAVARTMGASSYQIFGKVIFPYLLPTLMAGFRFGVSLCFVGAIIPELFLGGGVGGLIREYAVKFMPAMVFALVLVVGVFCAAVNLLLLCMERRAGRWR
jgi:NitT/TauT family transport system permease protein